MAKKPKQAGPQAAGAENEYSIGTWSGQPHYKCGSCPVDTLDKQQMLTHLVDAHSSEAALEELFPGRDEKQESEPVLLQEPAMPADGVPEGDPANGVYGIDVEEVENATSNPE